VTHRQRLLMVTAALVVIVAASAVGVAPRLIRSSTADPCVEWQQGSTCQGFELVYSGFGKASAERGGFDLLPAGATAPADTHAALAVRQVPPGSVDVSADIRTTAQLRHPAPNPWEVGWLVWRYVDDAHFYAVALKPNGWEISKEDPAYPGAQRFLATGTRPTFPVGATYRVRVRQDGPLITVDMPGKSVTVRDHERTYRAGAVGLYTEDAEVQYSAVTLVPAAAG